MEVESVYDHRHYICEQLHKHQYTLLVRFAKRMYTMQIDEAGHTHHGSCETGRIILTEEMAGNDNVELLVMIYFLLDFGAANRSIQ